VWAYAVTLWEMFSYGFQPWTAFTGHQILEAIDKPNFQRLEQPECCPKEYYSLMLKCWDHDPLKRPKFSEIYKTLPDIKPEQLKTVTQCIEMKKDHLTYRQNDIITVLDKTINSPYWMGVLNSGRCGLFNPANTVAHIDSLPSSTSLSGTNTSQYGNFIRNTLERNSKRKLKTDMISSPQNDFKHTGHVGIDGAYFGNVAFLSNSQTYNKLPRQVVTPYKPSEDLEQTPLLLPPTPTSPDSTQTGSAYFSESSNLFLDSDRGTQNCSLNNNESLSSDFQRITTTTRPSSIAFNESNPFAQSDHQMWTTDMGKNFISVSIEIPVDCQNVLCTFDILD
jgi:activated CDC42 kinase 1